MELSPSMPEEAPDLPYAFPNIVAHNGSQCQEFTYNLVMSLRRIDGKRAEEEGHPLP